MRDFHSEHTIPEIVWGYGYEPLDPELLDGPAITAYDQWEDERADHAIITEMDGLELEKVFGTAEDRQQLLEEVSVDEAILCLDRINGIVRGLSVGAWGMSGAGGVVDAEKFKVYDPPMPQDRLQLMSEIIAVAKIQQLDYAATLVGVGEILVHPYWSGNARSARVGYSLIAHGYDGSASDRSLYNSMLVKGAGRDVLDLNPERYDIQWRYAERSREAIAVALGYDETIPEFLAGGYDTVTGKHPTHEKLLTSSELREADCRRLHSIVSDPVFGVNAIAQYMLEQHAELDDYIIMVGNSIDEVLDGLNLDVLLPELNMVDVAAISNIHRTIKREFVQDFIDIFASPDRADEAKATVEFYKPAWLR